MFLYLTVAVSIITIRVARVVLHHRQFRQQEYISIFERKAKNENVEENKVFTVVENQHQKTRTHRVPQKETHIRVTKYYKNL